MSLHRIPENGHIAYKRDGDFLVGRFKNELQYNNIYYAIIIYL